MSTILKLAIKGSEVPPVPGLKDDILAALKSIDSKVVADPSTDPQKEFAEALAEVISQRVAVAVQDYLNTSVLIQVAPGIALTTTTVPLVPGVTTSPGTGKLIAADPPAQPNP